MTSQPDGNPYVGPRAISYGEPIYGRDLEIEDLTSTLVSQRIVLLYSPSGAGKSSLVEAGVRPCLEERGFHVLPTIRVGHMFETGTANRYLMSTKLSLSEAVPEDQRWDQERIAAASFEDYLDRVLSVTADPDRDPCIVFDQFEELFTLDPADWEEKEAFLIQLGVAMRQRSRWALFSMREDYIAQLDPLLSLLPTRLSTRYRLDLLEPDAARTAMVRPAEDAGVLFTGDAADQLIDDLRRTQVSRAGTTMTVPGRYVEPVVLQAVCRRLWEQSATHDRIGVDDVAALGDVDHALADFCDDRFAHAAAESGVSEQRIRDWVEEDLITTHGFRSQSAAGPADTGDLVLRALEDGHLLRAESRRGTTWYEIPHDRLVAPIRSSNRRWLGLHLDPVQTAARTWNDQGRSADLLLRGAVLDNAERWLFDHPGEIAQVDREFVEAGRDEQRQLDDERRRNRRDRRQRTLVAALAVLSVGLAAVVVYFVNESLESAEAAEAEAAATAMAEAEAAFQIAATDGSSSNAATSAADAAEAAAAAAEEAEAAAARAPDDEAAQEEAETAVAEAAAAQAIADATREAISAAAAAEVAAAEAAAADAADAAAADDERAQAVAAAAKAEAEAVALRVDTEANALEESLNWVGDYRPESPSDLDVRLGDIGSTVGWLQHELRARGLDLEPDCFFGRATEAAVKDVQLIRALPVTGVADDALWGQLGVDAEAPDRPVTCQALGDGVEASVCRMAVPMPGVPLVVRNVPTDDPYAEPISGVEEILDEVLAVANGDAFVSDGECRRIGDVDWLRLDGAVGWARARLMFLDREPLQVSSPPPAPEGTATTVPADGA